MSPNLHDWYYDRQPLFAELSDDQARRVSILAVEILANRYSTDSDPAAVREGRKAVLEDSVGPSTTRDGVFNYIEKLADNVYPDDLSEAENDRIFGEARYASAIYAALNADPQTAAAETAYEAWMGLSGRYAEDLDALDKAMR